jgi:GGDEF domain-containing protein
MADDTDIQWDATPAAAPADNGIQWDTQSPMGQLDQPDLMSEGGAQAYASATGQGAETKDVGGALWNLAGAPLAAGARGLYEGGKRFIEETGKEFGDDNAPTSLGAELSSAVDVAADKARETQEKLAYTPQTSVGEAINKPFEWLGEKTGQAGQAVLDATGSPLLATIADVGLQGLAAEGLHVGLKGVGKAADAMRGAEVPALDATKATESVAKLNTPDPAQVQEAKVVDDLPAEEQQIADQTDAAPVSAPETPGAPDQPGLPLDNEQMGPPPVSPDETAPVSPDETPAIDKANAPDNFTAEQRRESAVNDLIDTSPEPLSDAQQAHIRENYAPVVKDRVTGLDKSEELRPTLEAAQKASADSGAPSAYGEVDLKNLGGTNARLGNSGADVHFKAVADILQDEAEKANAHVALVRKGGDEIGAVFHGVDKAGAADILANAKDRIDAYAKEHGLDTTPNPKAGGEAGFGINYGTADIVPDGSLSDTVHAADTLVEQRKKGAPYEQRATNEAAGPKPPAATGADAGNRPNPPGVRGAPERGETQGTAAQGPPTPGPLRPGETSIANRAIDAERAKNGQEPLTSTYRSQPEARATAQANEAASPGWAARLVDELQRNPRPLKDTEHMGLLENLKASKDAQATARSDILKAREAGDTLAETKAQAALHEAEAAEEANHRAARLGGSESGRGLAARAAVLREDDSLGRLMDRAKVTYGSDFNAAHEAQVRNLAEQLREAHDKLAAAQERANKPASKRTPMTDEERQHAHVQRQIQAKLKQINDLQDRVKKRLDACPI